MGGKLQFNVIVYHMLWEDMQLELTDPSFAYGEPFQTVLANVGDAVNDGVDVDINFLVNDHISLGLVASYLFKNEIDEDVAVFDERDPEDLALYIPAGTQLPLTSDTKVSAFAQFSWPVDWFGSGDVYLLQR